MSIKKRFNYQKILSVLIYLFSSVAFILLVLGWLSNNKDISFKPYVIQSGSMEPSIMTGDMVIVKSEPEYQVNDVITFTDESDRVVTHRVLKKINDQASLEYETKGDANQSSDSQAIPYEKVIGKVHLVIPKLGFVVAFAQSRQGIVALIIIPVILIVYDELKKIFAEVNK